MPQKKKGPDGDLAFDLDGDGKLSKEEQVMAKVRGEPAGAGAREPAAPRPRRREAAQWVDVGERKRRVAISLSPATCKPPPHATTLFSSTSTM